MWFVICYQVVPDPICTVTVCISVLLRYQVLPCQEYFLKINYSRLSYIVLLWEASLIRARMGLDPWVCVETFFIGCCKCVPECCKFATGCCYNCCQAIGLSISLVNLFLAIAMVVVGHQNLWVSVWGIFDIFTLTQTVNSAVFQGWWSLSQWSCLLAVRGWNLSPCLKRSV